MKVAVVGGNFLGCASAYYIRRALDARRGPAGGHTADPEDDIFIFERRPSLGGNKFVVSRLEEVEVLTGTAADSDFAPAPLFNSLLSDAGVPSPERTRLRSWSIFDWDRDRYPLSSQPSRILQALGSSPLFCILFHLVLLTSSLYFVSLLRDRELLPLFRELGDVKATFLGTWLFFSVMVGLGVVPFPFVAHFYNLILMTHMTDLSAQFAYGTGVSAAGEVATQFVEHMTVVRENDAAKTALTVHHLLARCGLLRYARVAGAETLAGFGVHDKLRAELVAPALVRDCSDSRVGSRGAPANAVAAMLAMVTRLRVPTRLRAGAAGLSINTTKTLCPSLASAARARLRVCSDVVAVNRDADGLYELTVRTAAGERSATGFDTVVLAAVVEPAAFTVADGILDGPLREELALGEPADPSVKKKRNSAQFVTLVAGELRAEYFGAKSTSAVADRVAVINGVDCAGVDRIYPRTNTTAPVYRVYSAHRLEKESTLTKALFERVQMISSQPRKPHPYTTSPLTNPSGPDVPGIVLATRFLYAAATDRVANHVEVDCMAARNVGSFFRDDGVITWK